MMKKTLIIITILILLTNCFVFAETPEENIEQEEIIKENLDSLTTAIKNNPAELSAAGRNALTGIGGDFLNIIRYIVITTLLIRMLMLFLDFTHAGDNPQAKATIKSKTIWLSLGVIFAVNFWSIYKFTTSVLSNLNF